MIVSRGATIGRTTVVQLHDLFCLMGSVILVKPIEGVVPRYAACVLRCREGQKRLVGLSGSTAQQAIYIRDIRSFALPLPPITEQNQILSEVAEKLLQIEAAEVAIDHSLRRAARLRQSILKQAFEGKLVPQHPTDEPASTLLKKIKSTTTTSRRQRR